jgi:hypothetical protein
VPGLRTIDRAACPARSLALVLAGIWILVGALDRNLEHAASTVTIIASALLLPSVGATLGYELPRGH